MQTALQAWLSRQRPIDPLDGIKLQERPRAPTILDPIVEVRVMLEIFVNGTPREVGSKALMSQSDAHALSQTIPPTVEFLK
jgi:hypothetical protein